MMFADDSETREARARRRGRAAVYRWLLDRVSAQPGRLAWVTDCKADPDRPCVLCLLSATPALGALPWHGFGSGVSLRDPCPEPPPPAAVRAAQEASAAKGARGATATPADVWSVATWLSEVSGAFVLWGPHDQPITPEAFWTDIRRRLALAISLRALLIGRLSRQGRRAADNVLGTLRIWGKIPRSG